MIYPSTNNVNSEASKHEPAYHKQMWGELHRHKDGVAFVVIVVMFSCLYTFLAPNVFMQDWDSLMYAYQAEVDGMRAIWGNHPLAHVILNSIFILLTKFGYQGRALPINIVSNGFFGGVAVGVLFLLFSRILNMGYIKAIAITIILGGSYAFWHYSGSADVYSLSILLLVLAWFFLIKEVLIQNRRFIYLSGLLAGFAVLSHQLNIVFFLAALVVIFSQRDYRWGRILSFFGTAIFVFLAGSLISGYIANSTMAINDIYPWIRGYLGDPIYGTYLKLDSIPVAVRAALRTVLYETYGRSRFLRMAFYLAGLASVFLGLTQIKQLDRKKHVIIFAAALQCVVTWLLILWFEPFYIKFYLLTLVPSVIIFALCLEAIGKRFELSFSRVNILNKSVPLILVAASLFVVVFNLRSGILPEHQPDQVSQEAVNIWLQYSEPKDILITAGDLIPQLLYWENRPNTVHLYDYLIADKHSNDRFGYLRGKIDQNLCNGDSVVFAPAIIENFLENFLVWLDLPRDDLRGFFDAYDREELFTYVTQQGIETQVYRLINPKTCDD